MENVCNLEIETTDSTVRATKRGLTEVIAWIDPEGFTCSRLDSAMTEFQSSFINITSRDRRAMIKAIQELKISLHHNA